MASAREILAADGLTGCVRPHSTDCRAPYDQNCPLYHLLDEHMDRRHGGWLVDCQQPPCASRYAKLRAKAAGPAVSAS